jgi:hypothetical protein
VNDIAAKYLLKEGTIVITRRDPVQDFFMDRFLKFVHMGIVAEENGQLVIYDLHPDNRNNVNGNLDKKSVDDYMKGRRLIGIYPTDATTPRIQQVAARCWRLSYEKYYFNCQKFIDDITLKQFSSDLYSYYSGIILGTAGLAILGTTLYLALKD